MLTEGFLTCSNVTTQDMRIMKENNTSSSGSKDDSIMAVDTGMQSMVKSITDYFFMDLLPSAYFDMELLTVCIGFLEIL